MTKRLDPQQPASDPARAPVLFRLEQAALRVGPRHLLPNTTWTLRTGQNWVIMGNNGAGKTTLAGTLTGETAVVAGRRWVDPSRLGPSTVRTVSFETHQRLVAGDQNQDEARSFAHRGFRGTSVREVLENTRTDMGGDHRGLDVWLKQTGLFAWRDREVRNLSTGEIRQVMIARALLAAPRLLIIDEPFDGLDAAARRRLGEMLSALMLGGLQMILITHHRDEILPEITHYLLLRDGQVAEQGPWRPPGGPSTSVSGLARPNAARLLEGNTAATDSPGETSAPDLIRMRDVTVVYERRTVLDRLNWRVRPGENWVICGPNGSGKSTILQMVCGDNLQAYANAVYLFGRRRGSGETIWDIKRRIGLVSSALQLGYRKPLSGLEVILSGFFDSVGLYRRATADQAAAARQWATRLSIAHLLDRPFLRMSSGERRMVLIVRAMVKQPALLILDEPCQGLDAHNRRHLLEMLATIVASAATQLIYVSHRVDEIPAGTTHELHLAADGTYAIRRRPAQPHRNGLGGEKVDRPRSGLIGSHGGQNGQKF